MRTSPDSSTHQVNRSRGSAARRGPERQVAPKLPSRARIRLHDRTGFDCLPEQPRNERAVVLLDAESTPQGRVGHLLAHDETQAGMQHARTRSLRSIAVKGLCANSTARVKPSGFSKIGGGNWYSSTCAT